MSDGHGDFEEGQVRFNVKDKINTSNKIICVAVNAQLFALFLFFCIGVEQTNIYFCILLNTTNLFRLFTAHIWVQIQQAELNSLHFEQGIGASIREKS